MPCIKSQSVRMLISQTFISSISSSGIFASSCNWSPLGLWWLKYSNDRFRRSSPLVSYLLHPCNYSQRSFNGPWAYNTYSSSCRPSLLSIQSLKWVQARLGRMQLRNELIYAFSTFQQLMLFDLAERNASFFESVYRSVPMYFLTLVIILVSCLFYWALSWYLEKIYPGTLTPTLGS